MRRTLLLCADALRADALGTHGGAGVRTPNLDALASEATVFEQHYANAVPCGPSRTSLLTGLYPMTHRVVDNTTPFDGRLPNLASQLRRAGMPAYLVGYTDTVVPPLVGPDEGVMPGMQLHTHFNLNAHGLRAWTGALTAAGIGPFDDPFDVFVPAEDRRAVYPAASSDTAFVADRTIACLREHRDEPWFVMTSFLRPHSPWVAPEPYDTMYGAGEPAWPAQAGATGDHVLVQAQRSSPANVPGGPPGDVETDRAVYRGLVTELDHHVGRILQELEDLGLAGETLVVLTSDHGEMLGDHGLWGSRAFFDAALHLPLLVRAPLGVTPPARVQSITEVVDLAPTVLEWMGAPALPWSDGASLLGSLSGEGPPPERAASFTEFAILDLLGTGGLAALGLGPADCTVDVWRTATHKYVHTTALPPLLLDVTCGEEPVAPAPGLIERYRGALLDHRLRHTPPRAPALLDGAAP